MCTWDARSTVIVNGTRRTYDIDILYVVGFGRSIPIEEVSQEFDTLIRVTLSDWSSTR